MTTNPERRAHPRIPITDRTLQAEATPQGGVPMTFPARAQNISRGGVGFWYEKALDIGTPCHVELPLQSGESLAVEGRVANCRRVALNVHEIGVAFETPLDESHFDTLALIESR